MKIDMKRAESYTKYHEWLINKGATKKTKNEKDNKCFQYPITLALNYKIKKKRFEKNTKD